jgi:hypothetical protein
VPAGYANYPTGEGNVLASPTNRITSEVKEASNNAYKITRPPGLSGGLVKHLIVIPKGKNIK